MKKPKTDAPKSHESQLTQRLLERIAKDEKEYALTIERADALKVAVQAASPDLNVETRFGKYGVEVALKQKRRRYLTEWELFNEDTFDDVEGGIISLTAHTVASGRLKKHG